MKQTIMAVIVSLLLVLSIIFFSVQLGRYKGIPLHSPNSEDTLIADETWYIAPQFNSDSVQYVFTYNENFRKIFKDCNECIEVHQEIVYGDTCTWFQLSDRITYKEIINYE